MRLFFLLALSLLFNNKSFSQDVILLPWLTDSIEFAIASQSAQYNFEEETMIPGKNFYHMKLTDSQMKNMSELTYKEWECLLKDKDREYLINVILNHIYERDISPFYLRQQRKEWFDDKFNKEKELNYWLHFLKKNMPISFPCCR